MGVHVRHVLYGFKGSSRLPLKGRLTTSISLLSGISSRPRPDGEVICSEGGFSLVLISGYHAKGLPNQAPAPVHVCTP